MPRVFLCYRRDDSPHATGRLYDHLAERLGADNVFKDVYSLGAGVEWAEEIRRFVERSDAFLIVIGDEWMEGETLEEGDPLRREIDIARAAGVRIIPVLLDSARLPKREDLPEALRWLRDLNAARIRDSDFSYDFDRLLAALGGSPGPRVEPSSSGREGRGRRDLRPYTNILEEQVRVQTQNLRVGYAIVLGLLSVGLVGTTLLLTLEGLRALDGLMKVGPGVLTAGLSTIQYPSLAVARERRNGFRSLLTALDGVEAMAAQDREDLLEIVQQAIQQTLKRA